MSQKIEDPPITGDPAHADVTEPTRRQLLANGTILLSAAMVAGPLATGCAKAAEQAPSANQQADAPAGQSLYDRLGGIFAIAGVVNYFSDEIIKDPVAGARSKNPRFESGTRNSSIDCRA